MAQLPSTRALIRRGKRLDCCRFRHGHARHKKGSHLAQIAGIDAAEDHSSAAGDSRRWSHLGPLRRHLRTSSQAPSARQAPRLLGQLPNNYGSAEHAEIRIRNACVHDAIEVKTAAGTAGTVAALLACHDAHDVPSFNQLQVAVMFWYNEEWGDPEDCAYRAM